MTYDDERDEKAERADAPLSYDRKLSSAERAEEQKARILDATTELYAARGYAATRIEDIAASARVSRRTLYTHFRDLNELRFAVYERAVQATLMAIAQIASDPDEADPLTAALTYGFKGIDETPGLARVVLYEFRLPDPRNMALRAQILSFFAQLVVAGTRADYEKGRTPHLADELTVTGLLGMIETLVAYKLDDTSGIPATEDALPTALRIYRSVYPFTPKA
jgi:AcrR family transcriptional regulator